MTDLKQRLSEKIKRESCRIAENSDNESGSFLGRDLQKIRYNHGIIGANILAPQIVELVEALKIQVNEETSISRMHNSKTKKQIAREAIEKFNKFLEG